MAGDLRDAIDGLPGWSISGENLATFAPDVEWTVLIWNSDWRHGERGWNLYEILSVDSNIRNG
jgi:hypothetical protein